MDKNIFIRQFIWLCISLLLLLAGCTDEHMAGGVSPAKIVSLELNLNVPTTVSPATKAMSGEEEKTIDLDNLQVLVFEKIAIGEVFRYKAEVTAKAGLTVTVKVDASQNNEKYRLVVLANTIGESVSISKGDLKADVLGKFTFECAGKWNANGGSNSKPIPMWGECVDLFEITNGSTVSVLLHRALARCDVGLLFRKGSNGHPIEDVEGLDNFKIKSVRVYRTKNKAYVATDKILGNVPATAPNIPSDAKYNLSTPSDDIEEADKEPLVYELSTAADKYVREIYIPESFDVGGSVSPTMDNVPCLVIGGYYGAGNTTEETFYRADFAQYEDSKVAEYKSILRNHRYIFNIRSVTSPGFKEPEKALNSITTKMKLEVEAWNEIPLNFYLQGNYFFSVDKREVWLEAQPVGNKQDVVYKTNLTLQENKNIEWKWASSGTVVSDKFDLFFDLQNKKIEFKAKGTNIGGGGITADVLQDILIVTVENLEFTIVVNQKAVNIDYKLNCDKTVVHGKYREGIPLNDTHYIEVEIYSTNSEDLHGAEIEIVTETRKGVYFEYKNTLSTHGTSFTLRLQGYGTPVKDLNDPISPDTADGILTRIDQLEIRTNSIHPDVCYTTIIFGYKTKKILAIGANASFRYGYQLEPNTGSRAFVDASINFGVAPNSTVTIEQFPDDYPVASARGNAFHIEYMTSGKGMTLESINIAELQNYLNNFKPDIILTGQAIRFDAASIKAIADFVNKNGVLLMFNEFYPSAASINAMVGEIVGQTLTGEDEFLISQSKFIFTLPVVSPLNEEDKILNGPFGDLRGKTWATDGYCLHGFSGLPMGDIVVYNTRPEGGEPCFFRYTKKPFVFIGDGGFISNHRGYIGPAYTGAYDYCPFAINDVYQPIARTNYIRKNTEIENSRLFGNILTWAIDFAEHHGINKK